MTYEHSSPGSEDKPEILLAQGLRNHAILLLRDARTRDELELMEARSSRLVFRDRYVKEDSLAVRGVKDIDSILLTPNGHSLHPGDRIKHFFIYFPSSDPAQPKPESWPAMVWIRFFKPEFDELEDFVLTLDGLQRVDRNPVSEEVPQDVSYSEVNALREEIKSCRLAPQSHAPGVQ